MDGMVWIPCIITRLVGSMYTCIFTASLGELGERREGEMKRGKKQGVRLGDLRVGGPRGGRCGVGRNATLCGEGEGANLL